MIIEHVGCLTGWSIASFSPVCRVGWLNGVLVHWMGYCFIFAVYRVGWLDGVLVDWMGYWLTGWGYCFILAVYREWLTGWDIVSFSPCIGLVDWMGYWLTGWGYCFILAVYRVGWLDGVLVHWMGYCLILVVTCMPSGWLRFCCYDCVTPFERCLYVLILIMMI